LDPQPDDQPGYCPAAGLYLIAALHRAGSAALTWPVICHAFAMQQKNIRKARPEMNYSRNAGNRSRMYRSAMISIGADQFMLCHSTNPATNPNNQQNWTTNNRG
jgi:hypothetical protein